LLGDAECLGDDGGGEAIHEEGHHGSCLVVEAAQGMQHGLRLGGQFAGL
jgi:hypothetical protein